MRDTLLGLKPKDVDYAVEAPSFEAMRDWIASKGEVFPIPNAAKNYTVRASVKELGGAVDFVLCRKEGPYSDGRRPDWVRAGTLMDDLARRDFTMNAIAEDEQGQLIDPFGGQEHIKFRLITCVGNAYERFFEDSLRMLRAVRFHITKEFSIDPEIEKCFENPVLLERLKNVSEQRTVEELEKMFRVSTIRSIHLFSEVYPSLGYAIFDKPPKKLWLQPTLKE